jgi:hypothetical protein
MLKTLLGVVIFAALAILIIFNGGNRLDLRGDPHDAIDAPAEAASGIASGASATH